MSSPSPSAPPPRRPGRLARLVESVRREAAYYRRLIAHPRTPWMARACLVAALAYFVSPIDVIPDFVPVLGQLDDLLIVGGLVLLALKLIPEDVRRACREEIG